MYRKATYLILARKRDAYKTLLLCQYSILQVVTSIKTVPEKNSGRKKHVELQTVP